MIGWCRGKIEEVAKHITTAQAAYTSSITKTISTTTFTSVVEEDANDVEKALVALKAAHENWKTSEVKEVEKILG